MSKINEFAPMSAVVTSAQFRAKVGKVVLTMSNGDVIFAAPRVVNNVVGYELNPSTVQMIASSTVYYETSVVPKGTQYKWNASDEEVLVAESDLTIRNITSVMLPVDRMEFLMGHCNAIASQEDWDVAAAPKKAVEPTPEGATEEESEEDTGSKNTAATDKSKGKGATK